MPAKTDLLGAVVAHVIFVSSIITFISRMVFKLQPGHWIGAPLLLMAFPLAYLLWNAPEPGRPPLYIVQVGLMLACIVLLFVVDYWLKIDFRQTRWQVVSFVVLYFGALGGMIGVAAEAGRSWMLSAVLLFLIAAVLAFVQRWFTGI